LSQSIQTTLSTTMQRLGPAVLLLLSIMVATPTRALCQQDVSNPDEVLTLEQAIALAMGENHTVKNAKLEVGIAADTLAATRTSRLPSIQAFGLASEQLVKQNFVALSNPKLDVIPGVEPFFFVNIPRKPTAVFGAAVLEPLSQQYRIGLGIQQARLSREVQRENLRLVEQATVDKVKQAYYAILQTQSGLESIQEAIRLYHELDRVTADYVARQVSLRSDSLEVKTRLAKADYEALNLTNQLSTQKEQLNNLLGRDVRTDFRVSVIVDGDGFHFDLASARNRALDQRPELREARLKVKQAEVDRRIKKSEYIPDVSVGLAYMTFRGFNDLIPTTSLSVGVVMKWEVFDWGRKRDQLAGKGKAIEQANNELHETESLVLIDVGDKLRKLQLTRQALVVAQLAQDAAREGLRVNTNKYRLTAALLSDVLQSQANLAETNNQYQQALLNYWTAIADFEKAVGEDK
jgi:outer membrane protein TolC